MKKTRVFLTGGSGYIGKNIVEQLGDIYDFTYPRHSQLELLNSEDVEKFFKTRGPFEVVIHCAFVGGTRKDIDTSETLRDNLRIFFNIARNENYFGKLINMSSGAEYGKHRPVTKVKEVDFDKVVPLKTDYYGFAKYLIGKYIESCSNMINLRLFGVYGKYEDIGIRFISNVIYQVILKKTIVINKNVYFDYLYVDDLVKIIDHFIQKKSKFISYNVGCGRAVSLLTIAKKIVRILKSNSKITLKTKSLDNEYSCNNERLISELGVFEFTQFEDSIINLYNWYERRK